MPRILIIDDDAGVRGVLNVMLSRAGYEVTAAANGEEGLRAAQAQPPDLVLLDIEMPGMNGFDVCSHLKTDTLLKDVPVFIMTGRPVAGVPALALAVGAVDLLTKPFEREDLLKRLQAHLPDANGQL
jgi:CheY-like chemotaxis protein